jgi:hypothetical protein
MDLIPEIKKNVVVVTALYDIGRDTWEEFRQSYGGYIHWMEKTLSLNSKLVIYTQLKFKDEIESIRKKYDPTLIDTIIITQELEELPAYKMYNQKLETLMSSDTFINKLSFPEVPEMSKPLYNVIMFNKIFWIRDCIENKYFNNELVIWADAGGLREPIENYAGIRWPNMQTVNNLDPNKITFFSHNESFDVPDKEFHSLSQIRNIQGTAFFVPSHLIDFLIKEFCETIDNSLQDNYIGSDEKIFDITYIKNKHMYTLIKCTWREYFNIFK